MSARAYMDVDVAVMTSAGDPTARGARGAFDDGQVSTK